MKYILTYLLPLSTFQFELAVDWIWIYLKKKPDWFKLWHRALMITASIVLVIVLSSGITWQEIAKALILACWPYCFFDNLLAWMRKKRGLDYKGQTKDWDKWYTNFNPYAVMTVRILVALVLGYLYIRL